MVSIGDMPLSERSHGKPLLVERNQDGNILDFQNN